MKAKITVFRYWGKPRCFVTTVKDAEEAKRIAARIAKRSDVEQCGYMVYDGIHGMRKGVG